MRISRFFRFTLRSSGQNVGLEPICANFENYIAVIGSSAAGADYLVAKRSAYYRNLGVYAMNSEELRAIQAPMKELYKDRPEAALITLKAEGRLGEGITCKVQTGKALVEAGLHPATGGDGLSACSGDMLLDALVACAGVTLGAVSTAMGIGIRGGVVRAAQGDLDFRGTLGVVKDAAGWIHRYSDQIRPGHRCIGRTNEHTDSLDRALLRRLSNATETAGDARFKKCYSVKAQGLPHANLYGYPRHSRSHRGCGRGHAFGRCGDPKGSTAWCITSIEAQRKPRESVLSLHCAEPSGRCERAS